MNYSQNLRKAAIAKRVIISWVIVALIGVIVGGTSGYAIGSYITGKKVTQAENIQHAWDTGLCKRNRKEVVLLKR